MCLYMKFEHEDGQKPLPEELPSKTAKESIPCLKVVLKIVTKDENGAEKVRYISPWRRSPWFDDFQYPMGEVVNHDPPEVLKKNRYTEFKSRFKSSDVYCYVVDTGLHTWNPTDNGAQRYLRWLKKQDKESLERRFRLKNAALTILECEIPTGTRYFEGVAWPDREGRCSGYASDKLKVIKEREDVPLRQEQ